MLRKIVITIIFTFFCAGFSHAQNARITIEVTNAVVNDGIIYIAIFFNADEFKREIPSVGLRTESYGAVVTHEVTLPVGEYVISAYQDSNGNNRMDYKLFGIPKELVAMSNFFGKGFPSKNFNRQKIQITESTGTVTLPLHRF